MPRASFATRAASFRPLAFASRADPRRSPSARVAIHAGLARSGPRLKRARARSSPPDRSIVASGRAGRLLLVAASFAARLDALHAPAPW